VAESNGSRNSDAFIPRAVALGVFMFFGIVVELHHVNLEYLLNG